MSESTKYSVEVALATFNSERFLRALLESLFRQTYQDFTLLISDDGSSDSTLDIIAEFKDKYPNRIKKLEFGQRAGGTLANFSRLIDCLTADYVLFCDHDDIWLPDKIALSLERMRSAEARYGTEMPLLVHTDLAIVGPALEKWNSSFWRYSHLDPSRNSLRLLLMANTVTGCATIVNRALYERARPVPAGAHMHDHWFALVAATFGRIEFVEKSTILYRQHAENTVGARVWNLWSILGQVYTTVFGAEKRQLFTGLSVQASALLSRYRYEMAAEQYRTTETLANLWSAGRMSRFVRLFRGGLLLDGFARNVGLFVAVSRKD